MLRYWMIMTGTDREERGRRAHRKVTPVTIALLALVLAGSTPAFAQDITWNPATGIAGDADVSTNGTLVDAFNVGGPAPVPTTVNGVFFQPFPLAGLVSSIGNYTFAGGQPFAAIDAGGSVANPFASLSADYQGLLGSFAGNLSDPVTLTLGGLTTGATYEFQWWLNTSGFPTGVDVTATAVNGVTLDSNPSDTLGDIGEFAIGTFVASGPTQDIVFSGPGTNVLIDGFQLRLIAPPVAVPSLPFGGVIAMAALLLGALLAGARRASTA